MVLAGGVSAATWSERIMRELEKPSVPVEEISMKRLPPITVSGKWRGGHQGDGSGCSTVDPRAAKRAGREGPGPVGTLFGKVRQG